MNKGREGQRASLFGMGRMASAEDAAFYNTVTGAVTSRNDSSPTGICHPGSILFPVVLALAEEEGIGGKEVLEAVLCGYETMIRLGNTLVSAQIEKSFRNTALVAPFGAAFAAAKAVNLSEEETASAASFACHSAGGVNEWALSGTGEDVFQNGWGARNGIQAMRLARSGAVGCDTIIEGERGLLAAFGAQEKVSLMTEGLGGSYKILEVIHKPIDSCFFVQGPCQAAEQLLKRHRLNVSEIREVEIRVSAQAKNYPGCDYKGEILTPVQGIMSIPLGVASTLVLGDSSHIRWEPPFTQGITNLMECCQVKESEKLTKEAPEKQGAEVYVRMKSGEEYVSALPDVVPLTDEQVIERFSRTASERLGDIRMKKMRDMIWHLEEFESIHPLIGFLQ